MTSTIDWAPATTPGSRSVTDAAILARVVDGYGTQHGRHAPSPDFDATQVRIEYRKPNRYLFCPSGRGHLFVPRYDPVFGSTRRCGLCERDTFEVLHYHPFANERGVDTCVYRELVMVFYSAKYAALFAIADCGALHLWAD